MQKLNIPPLGIIENMGYFVAAIVGTVRRLLDTARASRWPPTLDTLRADSSAAITKGDAGVPLMIGEPDCHRKNVHGGGGPCGGQVSIASYSPADHPADGGENDARIRCVSSRDLSCNSSRTDRQA
jgi:hypothetical protein